MARPGKGEHPNSPDDSPLFLVLLLINFTSRKPLIEDIERGLMWRVRFMMAVPHLRPRSIARINGTMRRKAMTMKMTIISGPMNIPKNGM